MALIKKIAVQPILFILGVFLFASFVPSNVYAASTLTCSDCITSADCPEGAICVEKNEPDPGCTDWAQTYGTNGNVCVFGCFPGKTKVETEGGMSKNIEDIKAGDKVVSQNDQGEKLISTVNEVQQPISGNMCQINFVDGDHLRVTNNHSMSTTDGWKAINPAAANIEVPGINATQLEKGDEIKKFDGTVGTVDYFSCWSEKSTTYNLKLEGGVSTYFADDYLAHNKGCPCGWTRVYDCSKSCNPAQRDGTCGWTKTDPVVEKYWCITGYCNVCPTPPPVDCTITTEANKYSVDVDKAVQFRASVTTDPANSTIDRVKFRCRIVDPNGNVSYETCDQSTIVSLNKNGDTTDPYAAMVTGVSPGNQRVRAIAVINGIDTCQDSKVFTVNATPSPKPTCNPIVTVNKNTIYSGNSSVVTVDPRPSPSPATVNVAFTLFNPNPAADWSINKSSDGSSPYTTNLTGYSGSSGVQADVYLNNSATPICTGWSPIVTVVTPGSWWQVKDADVTAAGGPIYVRPPDGKYYGLKGEGGYTGIPVASTQVDIPVGKLSQDLAHDWKAETATTKFGGIYDYQHFKDSVPSDINWNELDFNDKHPDLTIGNISDDGYYWYRSTNGLEINDIQSLGDRNVVLFVEGGELKINANIRVTKLTSDTIGSFVVFSKDNIRVDHNVTGAPSLDGLYLTDGTFFTGASVDGERFQLRIWGSVVALNGMSLERDLGDTDNVTTSSEFFRFSPDQILLFPPELQIKKTKWNEISP